MKRERELGEAWGARAHVLTHLLHLWRRLDQGRGVGDLVPIFAGDPVDDALDRDEVLLHVLLLMPSHHRLQGHRRPWVELVERRPRAARVGRSSWSGRSGRSGWSGRIRGRRLAAVVAAGEGRERERDDGDPLSKFHDDRLRSDAVECSRRGILSRTTLAEGAARARAPSDDPQLGNRGACDWRLHRHLHRHVVECERDPSGVKKFVIRGPSRKPRPHSVLCTRCHASQAASPLAPLTVPPRALGSPRLHEDAGARR